MSNSVYQRNPGGKWYFKYTSEGKRYQKCTGEYDMEKAVLVMQRFLKGEEGDLEPTLNEELGLYLSSDTNPRYRFAVNEGRHYSEFYAYTTCMRARRLLEIVGKCCPNVGRKHLSEIRRADVMRIREAIIQECGRCQTSAQLLILLKTVFSFLVSSGRLEGTSPAEGLPTISYEQKRRYAFPPQMISWAMSRKDLFGSELEWAYFCVLALTGMRRGEALALNRNKLDGNVYTLDVQITSGEGGRSVEKRPKCEVVRHIPLCRQVLDILDGLKPDRHGKYFGDGYSNWVHRLFTTFRRNASLADPANAAMWAEITPHYLRHSLNTNLLIDGQPALLVAEYLSWKHQELIDIQSRYTHFVASSLQPIADAIDLIYDVSGSSGEIVLIG